jgi:hypothetical protein
MSRIANGTFILNGQLFTQFNYDRVNCTAFSGNGPHRNNPASENVPNDGPIPIGRYYIVDRQSGGTLGPILDWIKDRDIWFALWRDDGTIDDSTFVDGVRRGEFRLHPKGRLGISLGCITLEYRSEFDTLRTYLLAQPVTYIPDTTTRTYGTVDVGFLTDTLDPRYRPGGSSTTRQA